MHIWGKSRAAGRVGSDFLSAIANRVGSTFRRVGSGPRKVTRGQLCGNLGLPMEFLFRSECRLCGSGTVLGSHGFDDVFYIYIIVFVLVVFFNIFL